jgi:hypothetical protein
MQGCPLLASRYQQCTLHWSQKNPTKQEIERRLFAGALCKHRRCSGASSRARGGAQRGEGDGRRLQCCTGATTASEEEDLGSSDARSCNDSRCASLTCIPASIGCCVGLEPRSVDVYTCDELWVLDMVQCLSYNVAYSTMPMIAWHRCLVKVLERFKATAVVEEL